VCGRSEGPHDLRRRGKDRSVGSRGLSLMQSRIYENRESRSESFAARSAYTTQASTKPGLHAAAVHVILSEAKDPLRTCEGSSYTQRVLRFAQDDRLPRGPRGVPSNDTGVS